MKIGLAVSLVATLFCASVWAGDFDVEGSGQAPLPQTLERAVCTDQSFSDCEACNPVGKAIDLGRPAYVFTTSDACNWSVSMGPIWIAVTQPRPAVVLFAMGNSLNVVDEVRNGMKSVVIGAGTAGWSRNQRWDFDGEKYVMVEEWSDEEASPKKPARSARSKKTRKGR
jgi:hypothetical protein